MCLTTYLKGGDGSTEEDQMQIGIWKRFRKQVSLVSSLFVYVLHLELCILHFRVLHHSSNIHSQVLCIPCLCDYAHCWSAKRIRDVWDLCLSKLRITFYILHFVFMHYVCTFCLQIYFSNYLSYILHCVYALYILHLSFKSPNYILHSTLCLCTMYAFFVFALFVYVDILFLILLVAFYIVSMHVYVCAHCVYSFCFKLY
jgi:hypothetical protein